MPCIADLLCLSNIHFYISLFVRNIFSKLAVLDAGSWWGEAESSREGGCQHFFQSTCLQFSLCINADYMQLFFTKEFTGMNVRASLTLSGTAWTSLMLAVGRITVVNPALCAPNTLQRYFNYSMEESFSAKMLIYIYQDISRRSPCHELRQQEAPDHAMISLQSLPG